MIRVEYETRYDGEVSPKICKIVYADNEVEVVTNLTLSNVDELEKISEDEIWQHMSNMVDYIKIKSSELTLVDKDVYPESGWPAQGWSLLYELNDELTRWWVYITRRDAEEPVQVIHHH